MIWQAVVRKTFWLRPLRIRDDLTRLRTENPTKHRIGQDTTLCKWDKSPFAVIGCTGVQPQDESNDKSFTQIQLPTWPLPPGINPCPANDGPGSRYHHLNYDLHRSQEKSRPDSNACTQEQATSILPFVCQAKGFGEMTLTGSGHSFIKSRRLSGSGLLPAEFPLMTRPLRVEMRLRLMRCSVTPKTLSRHQWVSDVTRNLRYIRQE